MSRKRPKSSAPQAGSASAKKPARKPTAGATGTPRPPGGKPPRPRSERSAAPTPKAPRTAAPPRPRSAGAPPPPPPELEHELEDDAHLGLGARTVAPEESWQPVPPLAEPPSAEPPSASSASPEELEAQIRALEARLDSMIHRGGEAPDGERGAMGSLRAEVSDAARHLGARLLDVATPSPSPPVTGATDAPPLSASSYFQRQWGRLAQRERAQEVDEFGWDPSTEQRLEPLLRFLYRRYFRVQTRGLEHLPSSGRCLVVVNHSGAIPLDGLMLRTALRLEHPTRRELRWLAEDYVYYLPFLGTLINRIGAVRACQENAERLLRQEQLVAVFPEGVKGIGKLYRDRYKLQRFGRGGFIRLSLRTGTPLIPCAIVGAEETYPMLGRLDRLSKALGVPYLPLTPSFPLLGPLGLLPAPTKWTISFGAPIHLEHYGPSAADDHVLVGRLSERVRAAISALLEDGLARRRSVFLG